MIAHLHIKVIYGQKGDQIMKKKFLSVILLTLVLAFNSVALSAPTPSPSPTPKATQTDDNKENNKTDFPEIHAESAIVLDTKSRMVIKDIDADKKVYPAGLTNIMTAIIVLENMNLSDTCQVTKEALYGVTYDQPQLGMQEGEIYSVEQLLHAIILNSNNDASNVLAVAVAGNTTDFVKKMNEKAEFLGLTNTHFTSPSGIHDENHYTTARDMATLAQYAMQYPAICDIAKTPKFMFPPTALRESEKTILSTNHLVSRYKYPYHYYANATGLKSGNSTEAGYCLVATATKNGFNVLSIVMGAPNEDANELAYSFRDTIKIFDYVFENYKSVCLVKKGEVIHDSKVEQAKNSTRLALTVENDVYATMKKTADEDIIIHKVDVTEKIKAPIKQGQQFGTATYSYNGRDLATVNLVAANEVKRDFFLFILSGFLGFIFHPVVIIIIVAVLYVWARLRIARNRKRRLRQSRLASRQNGRTSSTTISNRISDRSKDSSSFNRRNR